MAEGKRSIVGLCVTEWNAETGYNSRQYGVWGLAMSGFTLYQVLVAVVEEGSIAQAALRLNYSAAAVSKQLARLEGQLQVQLFHRSHKRLDITEAGRRFYPRCKDILRTISLAEDALRDENMAISGQLSITLSKSLARSPIFDLLSRFSREYPDIQLDIRFSDGLEDLHAEDLDFAFRLGKLEDSSHLIATLLSETQLVACATPEHLAERGVPRSFSDMVNGRLLLMSRLYSSDALRAFFNRENIRSELQRAHIFDDIEGVYQAVRVGMGIGFLLDISVQPELDDGRLVSVLAERNLPRKTLYLVYKKHQGNTRRHEVFKDYVKAAFLKL